MNLEAGFEDDLREALLDDAERQLVGEQGNLVFQLIQQAHDILRAYGQRNDYDVEPVIESLGQVDVDRGRDSLTIRVGWEHEAAPFFELGTSDHTVEGNPLLSFVWEDPPAEVQEQWPNEGDGVRMIIDEVSVSGLPESRYVRDALHWLRRELT